MPSGQLPSILAIAVLAVLSAAVLPTPDVQRSAAEAAPARAVTIKITNFDFSPTVITVPAGTQITWLNQDDDAHDIVADAGGFRSTPLDTGDSYAFTFSHPGTYGYHCGLHPHMVGKVVVTP
jgi:plastocyanin